MNTTQKSNRAVMVCIALVFSVVIAVGIMVGMTAESVAQSWMNALEEKVSYSTAQAEQGVALIPNTVHPVHRNRSWKISQVGGDVVVAREENAEVYAQARASTIDEVPIVVQPYVGQGVVMIPHHVTHQSGRTWKISHL